MDSLKIYPDAYHFGGEEQLKPYFIHASSGPNPIDGIRVWNTALTKDFRNVLDELYQIRSSNSFSNLSSIVVQLQFLSDVLIFYR